MLTLRWRAPAGQYGQMIKVSCDRGSPLELHDHDYPEIFWIEEGPCLHLINGRAEELEPGDLVFIRPSDRHQFLARKARRFTMANLECHSGLLAGLRERHPQPFSRWFDPQSGSPHRVRLPRNKLQQLARLSLDFAGSCADALHTESFLLDLAKLTASSQPTLTSVAGPDWLRQALLMVEKPEVFADGVPGLVRIAGRSPEHVARTCTRCLGRTPTQIIDAARMHWAERQLRLTSETVTNLALACGYSTTAQFYRSFRKRYGQPPSRYRRWLSGTRDSPR
jgi:AraC family cel operon transcriptional repressor